MLRSLLNRLVPSHRDSSCEEDLEALLRDGLAAQLRGDIGPAEAISDRLLDLAPSHPDVLYLAGLIAYMRGEWDIALRKLNQALEKGGENPAYLRDYGTVLANAGRHREGLAALRRAVEIRPESLPIHSGLLFVISCSDGVTRREIYDAHRGFGRLLADPLTPALPRHPNRRDPKRRLNIGYVSADLREHAVSRFIEPVLARHDRNRHRICCYYNWPRSDAVTERLRGMADRWRDVADLPDAEFAKAVREDGIDILVDLSGHTQGNRLLAFARKPAPVQVTWFGAVQTTGMCAMDWRLTDAILDPPGATEAYDIERLARLPHYFACFRPDEDGPDVGPLPALAAGALTFASCNSGHKITEAAAALWSRLINAIPRSRLLMVVQHGELPDIQHLVAERFRRHGLDQTRLCVVSRRSRKDFLRLFREIDVLLDPIPQNGGITSLQALWMGVPVITLAGNSPISRNGTSILGRLGMDGYIAEDERHYAEIAARCAADLAGLAAMRAGLRERMRSSPLLDEQGFTLSLEKIYRDMWREWCRAA